MSSLPRSTALVIHDDGAVLDLLTGWLESSGLEVVTAPGSFRARTHLEGQRPIAVVIVPWDATHGVGGEVYRYVLAHLPALRTRFVFIADEVPPEFDAVVGGRCLAVPLSDVGALTRVANAIVRRATTTTPPRGLPAIGKPTLLLVEDDPMLLGVMAELLVDSGYAVVQAESIAEAIAALETKDFDAIVADWQVHDGSGAGLYTWIATAKPHLAERVVFLSEADQDDSGPAAPGRPMFRKGQDSQALTTMLRAIVQRASRP